MTSYLFRLWTGAGFVADVAEQCREAGLVVAFRGAEHVYVLHESALGPKLSERFVASRLAPLPGMVPVLWAKLTDDEATELRRAQHQEIRA